MAYNSMKELLKRPKARGPEKTRTGGRRFTAKDKHVDVSGKSSHDMGRKFSGNKGRGKGDRW